jgi:hypothetical protein
MCTKKRPSLVRSEGRFFGRKPRAAEERLGLLLMNAGRLDLYSAAGPGISE